ILDNDNAPWRKFRLLRTLQYNSELEVTGTSTHSRQALLHAALAGSAYNLRNRYIAWTSGYRTTLDIAIHHRLLAVKHLRESASNPKAASTNSEYKELLAAMLSMITIDVFSGVAKTCKLHLESCESLIVAYQKRRTGQADSHIIRDLHRIFFYLRVMQIMTSWMCDLRRPTLDGVDRSPTESGDIPTFDECTDDRSYPISREDLQSYMEIDQELKEPFGLLCELIYGIPPRRGTPLLARRKCGPSLGPHVSKRGRPSDTPTPRSLIFHQATIILFCRRVCKMRRHHVQPYVRTLVYHLHQIEEIKDQENIKAGPLLWPTFVAASEAASGVVQTEVLR
ncbi:hypothetical protein BBP40_012065, partial [Aspergillus hancockii]